MAAVPLACTDLKESPTSSITPDNFYKTDAEVLGGLASVYAQLRATLWSYYNLSEITSDELIVPTRGSDWYDNGTWLEDDRHLWTASSPAGLGDINGAWNDYFQGIARANVVLGAIETKSIANKATIQAELRTLRAFYYYMLMDFFGDVPVVTTTAIAATAQASRDSVFRFIENELKAARADLPDAWPTSSNGRMTKGAANAILASMYINWQVFNGTVTAAGLQRATTNPRWTDASATADLILNSPVYGMASAAGWRAMFAPGSGLNPENILVVKHLNQDGLGLNFVMRALHYNQFNPSPWNGFATIADVYNAFDANDIRRQIFLAGPQVDQDPKSARYLQAVNDRQGNRLVFTTTIADITQATEGEGVRLMKWPPDANHVQQENGNDFAYFRYSEMMLIKAEAQNELGNTAAAMALVNQLRTRAGVPAAVAGTQAAARTAIFQERLFELMGEAKRRQDMIRAGTFSSAWLYHTASAPYRVLFPIPQTQLGNNALLKQNAGY